jgi:hypothetical protein
LDSICDARNIPHVKAMSIGFRIQTDWYSHALSFSAHPLHEGCRTTRLTRGNLQGRKPCICINKDGNSSTKSTRHVEANVNAREEDQDNQNSSNEVENVMLKGYPLTQIG